MPTLTKATILRAKGEFLAVCRLHGSSQEVHAARIRMGMRCAAVIDQTFLDAMKRCAEHQELCMVAVLTGRPRPPLPRAGAFQMIKTDGLPVLAYIPLEEAEEVFALGGLYQREQISAARALELVRKVSARISRLLRLDRPIEPLQFLSEELEQEHA